MEDAAGHARHLKGWCFSLATNVCWKSREGSVEAVAGGPCRLVMETQVLSGGIPGSLLMLCSICYNCLLSAIAPSISPFIHGRPRAVRVSGPVDLVVSNKAVARARGLAPAGTSELHVDRTRPVREVAHAQARQKLGIVVLRRRQCWVARGAGVAVHSRWLGVDVLLYDT